MWRFLGGFEECFVYWIGRLLREVQWMVRREAWDCAVTRLS